MWRVHTALAVAYLTWRPSSHLSAVWVMVGLPSGAMRRFYLTDATQAAALVEVFVMGDYDVPIDPPVSSIVDLGANAGQATLYLHDRFPDAAILAVEANPLTARVAARNFRGDLKVTVVCTAVTDHDGTAEVISTPGDSWASSVTAARTDEIRGMVVSSVKLGSLLAEHSIDSVDLLKVDIEGSEVLALTSDAALERVRCVIGEIHPSVLNRPVDAVLKEFQGHGGFDQAWLHRPRVFVLRRRSVCAP